MCRTSHPFPWVMSFAPFPPEPQGHVIVLRGDGVAQRLTGPGWQEDPQKWEPSAQVFARVQKEQD